MKLWSPAWANGDALPPAHALAGFDPAGTAPPADNISPPLCWADLPAGTRSLVLVCHDFDGLDPTAPPWPPGMPVPADLPRVDFFHWVLVDLPPAIGALAEGEFSRGFTPRGKPGPEAAHGARQGLNDYTRALVSDAALAGRYFGYDGPHPPPRDALVHHCLFALYALAVPRLPVAGDFTGHQVRDALEALGNKVLGAATLSGTCGAAAR